MIECQPTVPLLCMYIRWARDRHQTIDPSYIVIEDRSGDKMIAVLTVSFVILLIEFSVQAQGGLQKGFYSSTCPRAEEIVRSTVEKYFNRDSTIAAGLLRLHFHDCFVQVCLLFSFYLFLLS